MLHQKMCLGCYLALVLSGGCLHSAIWVSPGFTPSTIYLFVKSQVDRAVRGAHGGSRSSSRDGQCEFSLLCIGRLLFNFAFSNQRAFWQLYSWCYINQTCFCWGNETDVPSVCSRYSKNRMGNLLLAAAGPGPSSALMNFFNKNAAERWISRVYIKMYLSSIRQNTGCSISN